MMFVFGCGNVKTTLQTLGAATCESIAMTGQFWGVLVSGPVASGKIFPHLEQDGWAGEHLFSFCP